MAAEQVMHHEYQGATLVFHYHESSSVALHPLDKDIVKALAKDETRTKYHLAIMYLIRVHRVSQKIAKEMVEILIEEDKPAQA